MRQLEKLARDLESSRPIFVVSIVGDRRLRASVMNQYKPTPIAENHLSELLVRNYREYFLAKENRFSSNKDDIVHSTMQDIRSLVRRFLERNLPMRNPRQSKVYRWFDRNLPQGYDLNDNLCSMYNYMRTFCDSDMKSSNKEKSETMIALMEAIMEKYNE